LGDTHVTPPDTHVTPGDNFIDDEITVSAAVSVLSDDEYLSSLLELSE
jgi:hypothetical protein